MKLDKEKLTEALNLVKPGLASKELIEQSTSFAFMDGKVVTYNDEISLSHPVEGLEIEGAIKANEFYQFVSKVKGDEIAAVTTDNEIIFKSGRTKAGFTLQKEIKLPLDEVNEKGKWKKLPEHFCQFLSLAAGACGRDLTEAIMTCVCVQQDGYLIGSDRQKIMRCKLVEELDVDTFLIPASSALEVVSLQPDKIAESKGWVHFKTKQGTILSCRIFEDEYPEVDELMKVEGIMLTLPDRIEEMLEQASVFAKRAFILDETVDIKIAKGKFRLSAKSETGWFKDTDKIDTDEEIGFSITPYLLQDIMKETKYFRLSENAVKFVGDGWEYVASLKEIIE
jgi:DNA polymerase III sliding clamp (beta) subunit (PCNA family)